MQRTLNETLLLMLNKEASARGKISESQRCSSETPVMGFLRAINTIAMENVHEHFKGIFDGHGHVPDLWVACHPTLRVRCHLCLSTGLVVPL